MSMNLYAAIRIGKKDEEIPLRQTQAHVTYMILVNANGKMETLRGRDAVRALRAYCEWVKGDGPVDDLDREHIEEIMKYVRKPSPNLIVGIS